MNPLRLAVIGCGGIVRKVHAGNLKTTPSIQVVACVDLDENAASDMAGVLNARYHTTDAARVMADPQVDAVLIATHPDSHVPLSIAAAEAGKAILCEKPTSTGFEDALRLREVLKKTGVPYMTGYCYRFNHAIAAVHEKIRPYFSAAHITAGANERSELSYHLRENLCHAVDLICHFHRSVPRAARAQVSGPLLPLKESKARLTATLRFEDGSLAVFTVGGGGNSPSNGKWMYQFHDTDGVAEVMNYRTAKHSGRPEINFSNESAYHSGHRVEIELFADAVLNKKPVPIPFEEGLRVDIILDAIQKSAETDREVSI